MQYLLIGGGFALYFLLCRFAWQWKFTPRSKKASAESVKRAKSLRKQMSDLEAKKTLTMKMGVTDLFRNLPIIGLNKEKSQTIRLLISAVDKRTEGRQCLVEEIYFEQLTRAGFLVGLAIIGMIMSPFSLVLILGTPLIMGTVITKLAEEQKVISRAISAQFLSFYKRYYVQYIRPDATTPLANIVNGYIPQATPEFALVLTRFVSDLERGEEFALRQFDDRFQSNVKVHKFCSIVRARSQGDVAAYDTMRSFLAEMEEQHDSFFTEERLRREAVINRVVGIFLCTALVVMMLIQMWGMMGA